MSRTKRYYNNVKHRYQFRMLWLTENYIWLNGKIIGLNVKQDKATAWKQRCMGHCASCKRSYFREEQLYRKNRNADMLMRLKEDGLIYGTTITSTVVFM